MARAPAVWQNPELLSPEAAGGKKKDFSTGVAEGWGAACACVRSDLECGQCRCTGHSGSAGKL